MTGDVSVSVVIPTVGRESLRAAIASALNQTRRPREVIVVLDRDIAIDLPESDSIVLVKTSGGVGPSTARQLGVETASGDLIALLDDDDLWLPEKLDLQLSAAPPGEHWVVSSRVISRSADDSVTFPRNLIRPDQPLGEYLFSFHGLRFGGASLQTSTLLFPRSVAMTVPMSVAAGSVHDDPLWLMAVRKTLPDLSIVQRPEVLVEYGLTDESLSRSTDDRSAEYLEWGLQHLEEESPRVRGDYLVTSPVAAAVAAESLGGACRAIVAGARSGRPGAGAWIYAFAGVARITVKKIRGRFRRILRSRQR